LNKDPQQRPDAMTLLKHPFLSKSHDGTAVMKSLLDTYSNRSKPGQRTMTKSKRVLPPGPPPSAPTVASQKSGGSIGSISEGDSGSVVYHPPSTVVNSGDDDGTVVYHPADKTVVNDAETEESGTVVVRKPGATAAIGSMAQLRDAMKRHITIVSPTSKQGGSLVSKRDFFFIIVGAIIAFILSHLFSMIFS